jgi:ADP-ribosyl-[dinitrogen reductase] hydrolase
MRREARDLPLQGGHGHPELNAQIRLHRLFWALTSGVTHESSDRVRDALSGVLLGTALGDALGLPMEGMRATAIARAFPRLDRFFFLGRTGFVSDDTEQSALVAQSLARHPAALDRFVARFKRSLLGWFLRLPWAIGLGTLRACARIALGFRATGVGSAGNGAAMRAPVVGAFFFDSDAERRAWSDALARVTHVDPRAVEGARYVAELTALCVRTNNGTTEELARRALEVVEHPELREAIARAIDLARTTDSSADAGKALGNTGFIIHTAALTTFCFVRFGNDPEAAITAAVRAGGDTDSHAAIVGAWMGAKHGEGALPKDLIAAINDGPFGPSHLRALGADLVAARESKPPRARYSWPLAFARNVALFPVAIVHAFHVVLRR